MFGTNGDFSAVKHRVPSVLRKMTGEWLSKRERNLNSRFGGPRSFNSNLYNGFFGIGGWECLGRIDSLDFLSGLAGGGKSLVSPLRSHLQFRTIAVQFDFILIDY